MHAGTQGPTTCILSPEKSAMKLIIIVIALKTSLN